MWRFISRSDRFEKTRAAARKARRKFSLGSDPALESREMLASIVFHPLPAATGGVVNMATVKGKINHHAIVTVTRGSAGGAIFGVSSHQGTPGRASTPNTSLINGGRTVTTTTPATQFSPFSNPTFISATGQTTTTTPTSINSNGSFSFGTTTTSTTTSGNTTSSFTTTTSTTVPFGTLGTASNGQAVVFV